MNPAAIQLCYFVGPEGPCSPENIRNASLESWNIAAQKAKFNVEKHYSVVGLTSNLRGTIKLLEAYLPRFFHGAHAFFRRRRVQTGGHE